MVRRSASTSGTLSSRRLERRAAASVTSGYSGPTGWFWSTTSATAAASTWRSSSCSWSAAGSPPSLSSSWPTSVTCDATAVFLVRRVSCSRSRSAVASSRCLQLRRTMEFCWCSTGWSTWSGSAGHSGKAQPVSAASWEACQLCLGRNGPSKGSAWQEMDQQVESRWKVTGSQFGFRAADWTGLSHQRTWRADPAPQRMNPAPLEMLAPMWILMEMTWAPLRMNYSNWLMLACWNASIPSTVFKVNSWVWL